MQGLPQVNVIHATNGRWDLIEEIETRTLEEFDSVLANIRRFEGVSISEVNLLLSTKKSGCFLSQSNEPKTCECYRD